MFIILPQLFDFIWGMTNCINFSVGSIFNSKALFKSLNIESNLLGFNFVITGKLEQYTRTEIKNLILSLGGKVNDNINKNSDYLIAGSDPGSKLKKATDLKIKIIDENEFKTLIN